MIQRERESGQVAVEAALVMPLFVFLILGIMQMGLIAQARVMAKYAAYRAARVGAMNNADPEAIEAAAILHLLPVLVSSSETILPTGSATEVVSKFVRHTSGDNDLPGGVKQVKTVICGPLSGELDGSSSPSIDAADQRSRDGEGSSNEVDFDDPSNQAPPVNFTSGGDSLRRFNRTRLVVQIQFLYRMPIPFANWVIVKSYLGTKIPSVLMMPGKGVTERDKTSQVRDVIAADGAGVAVLPINVSYAMRMQSNFFLSRFALPSSNECISYGHPD
ncbi:TadE family protein [Hyalangium sp.]|uniref:TadE family protein n=1 Tax=Hyalangium sp. TaxID=2028555 RepID=UPI002D7249F6|nr:TadE family protein [Hyalangium sp.]HYH94535.1 TadE family protein [Hyalangium sp.]